MKGGLTREQLLGLVGGAVVLVGAIVAGWLGWGQLTDAQTEAQGLAEKIGNPALGGWLARPDGVEAANRETKQLAAIFAEMSKEQEGLVGPWSRATSAADGQGAEWAKDPGKWKDRLVEVRKNLFQKASASNVLMATNFYLGLESYQQKSPAAEEVPALARHLAVAERLVLKLMEARQAKEGYPTPCLLATMVSPAGEAEGKAAAPPTSELPAKGGKGGAQNSREIFTLELESSPEVLNQYIQLLARDDWPFVVRDLKIKNEKPEFAKRSEIAKKFTEETSAVKAGASPQGPSQPLLEVLAGNEKIRSRVVVEFVPWILAGSDSPGKAGEPNKP